MHYFAQLFMQRTYVAFIVPYFGMKKGAEILSICALHESIFIFSPLISLIGPVINRKCAFKQAGYRNENQYNVSYPGAIVRLPS